MGAHRSAANAGAVLFPASSVAAQAPPPHPSSREQWCSSAAGWNLALISGSVLLTADAPATLRPNREGWGEASMRLAAASGSIAAGPLVAAAGYPPLAAAGALSAATLLPLTLTRSARPTGE